VLKAFWEVALPGYFIMFGFDINFNEEFQPKRDVEFFKQLDSEL
jgi:hypothetical protein